MTSSQHAAESQVGMYWMSTPRHDPLAQQTTKVIDEGANSGRTKTWASQQLWTRVPSPLQHNRSAYRIYAADDDVDDVDGGETHNAAHAQWRAGHVDELDAAGVIKGALAAVHAAEEQLDNAVLRARHAGLSWARIGDAANMSAQAAHERWATSARSAAGGPTD
jgi:hypothetical protein